MHAVLALFLHLLFWGTLWSSLSGYYHLFEPENTSLAATEHVWCVISSNSIHLPLTVYTGLAFLYLGILEILLFSMMLWPHIQAVDIVFGTLF